MPLLKIVAGFWLLIKGADWLVEGATDFARRLQVPEMIIGLTIVSLGTSMPELVVGLRAVPAGASDAVMGNVLGSNIMNTLLVLGVAGLVSRGPLPFETRSLRRDIPINLLSSLVLLLLCNTFLFGGVASLSRMDGIVLLLGFLVFTLYMIRCARKGRSFQTSEVPASERPLWKSLVLFCLGVVALSFGGDLAVSGSLVAAALLGVSEKLIGVLVLAGGTSLPELVTSVVAVRKNQAGIAIGNVLGSNISNILLVLGANSAIRPLLYNTELNADQAIVIGSLLLLFLFMWIQLGGGRRERNSLNKAEAGVLTLGYLLYVVFVLVRS